MAARRARCLALDVHRHLVANLARCGAQALSRVAGRRQDRARPDDSRVWATRRGGAGTVLRRRRCDRFRVRVRERLRGDADDQEDEHERKEPLNEGGAALARNLRLIPFMSR